MVFPPILPKVAARWLLTFYRAARKLRRHAFQDYRNTAAAAKPSAVSPQPAAASRGSIPHDAAADRTVVCDMHGALLRSTALFPYFMLVAFEGGSMLRALLLLCAYPLVWALGERGGGGVRVMAFVTFAGLRPRDMDLVARAVLPKHYMEELNAAVYDRLWLPARRKVVVTSAPRVMAEWFLKEYMGADAVVGSDLQVVTVGRGRYYTGLLCGPRNAPEQMKEALRDAEGLMADIVVITNSSPLDHLLVPYCKGSRLIINRYGV